MSWSVFTFRTRRKKSETDSRRNMVDRDNHFRMLELRVNPDADSLYVPSRPAHLNVQYLHRSPSAISISFRNDNDVTASENMFQEIGKLSTPADLFDCGGYNEEQVSGGLRRRTTQPTCSGSRSWLGLDSSEGRVDVLVIGGRFDPSLPAFLPGVRQFPPDIVLHSEPDDESRGSDECNNLFDSVPFGLDWPSSLRRASAEIDLVRKTQLLSFNFDYDDIEATLQALERSLVAHSRAVNRHLRAIKRNAGLVGINRSARKIGGGRFKTAEARALSIANEIETTPQPTRYDKVTISVRTLFLKVGDINTIKENFMAQVFIQLKWREPALDGQVNIKTDDIDWKRYWNPNLYIDNSLETRKEVVWQTISFDSFGRATIYERRHVTGCFIAHLQLVDFPFDTQDLSLTLSTERTNSELELSEDDNELSGIDVSAFGDAQEWQLHGHVETRQRLITRTFEAEESTHPVLATLCRASRRPGFFFWNVFIVMFFICSMAFTTFAVDFRLSQNRLQLSFFLLLTTVTFKFVVNQALPRISYLTHLDKYILTSMAILCSVCVWHAVVPLMNTHNGSLAQLADVWALVILGSIYFAYHIFFFVYIYFFAMRKRWYYIRKDEEYREKLRLQRTTSSSTALYVNTVTCTTRL